MTTQARTQVLTILFWSAIFLLTAAWLEGFIEPTYMLFRRIPQGYNEGWNAYWAQVAWQGGALYPAPNDAISNNYPPLSFYIVGAFGRLIGDNIFAGRLVAEISLLMVGGSIWSWLRAAGMSRSLALFGASLFLAAFVSFGYEYVGTDDPQMLAHAMIITGVMILWRFDFSRRSIVAGGLLIVFGVLTKHLLLPVPFAVTAWMALYRRDRLGLWLVTSVIAGLLALAVIWLEFGTVFFHDLLSSRVYIRLRALSHLHDAWQEFGWLLILGSGAFLPALRHNASAKLRQFAAFTLLYLGAAVAIGTFASGGKGVDRNAFFDALIAATLAVAAVTSYLREQVHLTARRTAPLVGMTLIAAACGATWAWAAVERIPSQWHDIQQADRREAETVNLVQTIRDLGPDSTACEQLALCYWAHAQFKIDFFNFGQKLATGALAPETCRRVFSSDSVRLIQSSTASSARATISKYLPGRCNEELTQTYVPIASSANGTIFRPGSATDGDSTP